MIATWMLYCSVCALGLSLAAALAERTLLSGRGPLRVVWVAALALSLIVPMVAFRFAAQSSTSALVAPAVAQDATPERLLDTARTAPVSLGRSSQPAAAARHWSDSLRRADEPLAVAWVLLSIVLACYSLAGMAALAWMRRRWEPRELLGVRVLVSKDTGPAVVGAMAPAIVVPEWVLEMEPPQLALMLRHEEEHRRASDGRLLAAAQLVLIAMPWNVALWWQLLRLRVAVELDCDARVLQDADPRSYGDLLLEVARPRRGPNLLGATAFAERATQLERRIRVLGRHRARTSRSARAVAAGIGLAVVTVAWAAPRPPAPTRPVIVPTPPLAPPVAIAPAVDDVPSSSTLRPTTKKASKDVNPTPPLAANVASDTPIQIEFRTSAPCTRTGAPEQAPTLADSAFDRLFAGITLTSDRRATACELLTNLQQQQIIDDYSEQLAIMANQASRAAVEAQRDAALRALLTNDADRATLDARLAQSAGGRRGGAGGGRTGGPPPDGVTRDSAASTGRGGGRGDGGGRGRGGLPLMLVPVDSALRQLVIETTFHRLFDGIALTADQEAGARALITTTQQFLLIRRPQRAPVRLRLPPSSDAVAMSGESAAALIALVSSDADRATLQSRIVSIP